MITQYRRYRLKKKSEGDKNKRQPKVKHQEKYEGVKIGIDSKVKGIRDKRSQKMRVEFF